MNLNDIHSPADIKKLDIAQLRELAGEIRQALLQKLSEHGGHVGPNLGMVEAEIALHYVFDSPKDKIIFDVSHQSYVHKMLTGRMQAFTDPRHYNDVTGFTNPKESPHDFFTVGHTSTGVSLATGLAKARDLQGGTENIIAVVGDGSLSGGEAFEGLDNAAVLHSNFIVVVNDNQMAIAENHGGLYADLHLLRSTRGEAAVNYFRSLGFAYRYVAQGNDVAALIDAFRDVKDSKNPVVVHIVTEKGEGYEPAVRDKEKWHFESPFNIATGTVYADEDTTPDYADITAEYLLKRIKDDPKTVVISSATPDTIGFTPERRRAAGANYVDVGIAEEHAAAFASGLAKGGMRPFWGVMTSFMQRAFDQIQQDIAINNNPAVIGIFGSTLWGTNDVTHLCWFDIPMISNIPNVVMLAPADRAEYMSMLKWALDQTTHPVAIRVPAIPVADLDIPVSDTYDDLNTFQQVRAGHGVAIIAVGNMLGNALKAADILKADGYEPTVINPRFLSGLDAAMLSSLEPDHTAVVTVEDGCLDGGFGQKVAAFYGDRPMLVRNLGIPKKFLDVYNREALAKSCCLTPETMAASIREMFK